MTLALRVSAALAMVASITAAVSFTFWGLFSRDTAMGVGNLRGTALTVLLIAVPVLIMAMSRAMRGSLRAQIVWLACLAYLAYNAVMFCFAAHFNSLFLLFTTFLSLAFWALVTLLRALDVRATAAVSQRIPARFSCCRARSASAFRSSTRRMRMGSVSSSPMASRPYHVMWRQVDPVGTGISVIGYLLFNL